MQPNLLNIRIYWLEDLLSLTWKKKLGSVISTKKELTLWVLKILAGMVSPRKPESEDIRHHAQILYDLRWKTWQAGLYDLLVEACSNFLEAASFSSNLFWTKYLIHQDELRNLAFTKWTFSCYLLQVNAVNFLKRSYKVTTITRQRYTYSSRDLKTSSKNTIQMVNSSSIIESCFYGNDTSA